MTKSDDPQPLSNGPASPDDFYRALGYALVAFTEIDAALFALFYTLTMASMPDIEHARKIFTQTWNFGERLKIVARAVAEHLADPALRAEWEAMRTIMESLKDQRNQLAHASTAESFAIDKKLGLTLVPVLHLPGESRPQRTDRLDTQGIIGLAIEFEDMADRIGIFLRRVAPEHAATRTRGGGRTRDRK